MIVRCCCRSASLFAAVCVVMLPACSAFGQSPALKTVFPAGGQAGQSVEVTVSGDNLQGLSSLRCNVAGVRCEQLEPNRFRLTIPAATSPGLYDVWAVGDNGISAPRTFAVGNRVEQLEVEPKETPADGPISVPLDVVINGRIDKANDTDQFRFSAQRGQRVILECRAERIDSRLRAVLELFNDEGRRLAVNRGYFGVDPLIDFQCPADGSYVVKVQDLISSGSPEHYYRLDIDTGPRVAFSIPNVIQRGKSTRVSLYGWNLIERNAAKTSGKGDVGGETSRGVALDRVEVEIPAALAEASWPLPVLVKPAQVVLEGAAFPYHLPGSHHPVVMGVTDLPVVLDASDNHSPSSAQEINIPCEVSGQLAAGKEVDWFSFQARRGEVLFIETLGQRIHSPVDLQIGVLDASGERELALFRDEVRNSSSAFPIDHLDPEGRWVCPADGGYLITVRNLIGGLNSDPRRTYRLKVQRAAPDFQIVAVPRADHPIGLNVQRGGRAVLDLLAFRRRGHEGSIRVSATDLPLGIRCPNVWLGPGVDRATVVVSADENAAELTSELKLSGVVEKGNVRRTVRGGTMVRAGTPNGWGRIISQLPLAVAGDAPLRITANGHAALQHHLYGKLPAGHSPGGIVDVAIQIERSDPHHQAPVKLIGVGLPELIRNQTTTIPAGKSTGNLSFYLPPNLPVGRYSMAVQAETTILKPDKKTETIVVFSNSVTLDVQPAAFVVEVDPFAVTRAKRGETIQIGYSARRLNGFIAKMHTELAAPGLITDVVGLRGRGVTFVGQTNKGSIQIIVNDDAPLGRQRFLRLFTVGVLEDEPVYFGSCFVELEIVE